MKHNCDLCLLPSTKDEKRSVFASKGVCVCVRERDSKEKLHPISLWLSKVYSASKNKMYLELIGCTGRTGTLSLFAA